MRDASLYNLDVINEHSFRQVAGELFDPSVSTELVSLQLSYCVAKKWF